MRRGLLAPLALATALVLSTSTPAAGDDLTDARRERSETRRRQADAAAALDTLRADDRQLEKAAAALDRQVRAQELEVGEARRLQAQAEDEAVDAQRRLGEVQAEIGRLRDAVVARAVNAYVNSGASSVAAILSSGDFSEVARKKSYLAVAAERDRDVLDLLDAAEEDRVAEQERARRAAARAEVERRGAEAALDRLERTRVQQARVQRALDTRIEEFTEEVDALAAQERNLTALIRRHEARKAREAEAERRRRAAAARAAREAAARAARAAPSQQQPAVVLPPPEVVDRPDTRPPSPTGLIWPVSGPVTSGFGYRWGRMHQGLDIGVASGTPIHAASAGTVIYAGWMNGYGNVVLIDHGGGFVTVYAHQSRLGAAEGQQVSQGQVIGFVGSTGRSTGPHLHFETRVDGVARDPLAYLP